ncbi:dysbindin [Pangasianodon hypophthalmus]|uniref:dysbindin n=1 Tax=Pangasianodon hypophthalmus TaxID=310915 RepID=UPI000EFEE3B9|nr:dysbindin [Pangasianodon hypophthalmus]
MCQDSEHAEIGRERIMNSKGANLHNKRQPSETENTLRLPDMDAAQQLKLRERQRFFEEAFQHDVDVYFSSAHLQIDYKRAPMSSISSMEVNVDMLEQMDLLDISDQEALDVFLASTEEDDACSCPLEGLGGSSDIDAALREEISMRVPDTCELKSRISSTSSTATSDSQGEDGAETPVVQSDDEDVHDDDGLLINGTPPASGAGREPELSL